MDVKTNFRPQDMINMSLGIKTSYDQNKDLDTLDVKHFSVQPNVNLVMTPQDGLVFSAGYTYDYAKSRGPVTIPIFDG